MAGMVWPVSSDQMESDLKQTFGTDPNVVCCREREMSIETFRFVDEDDYEYEI